MLFNYLVGHLDYKSEEKMNCSGKIFYINDNQYLLITDRVEDDLVDNYLTSIST